LRIGYAAPQLSAGVVVFAAGMAFALPPDPQLNMWVGPANNCYNYGINQKDNDFKQPGNDNYGLPANPTAAQVGAAVLQGAKNDGLVNINWQPGQPIPAPPQGFNLVALGSVGGARPDYHWWRLNGDGTWSHKRGQTPAKTTYTDGQGMEQTLTDPRDGNQRDGYTLVGFMGTPKGPVGQQQQGLSVPPSAERVWDLVHSGFEDQHWDFFQLSALASHLPTGSPIPDPHWAGQMAGQSLGYGMMASSAAQGVGFPVYMRVYQGVVAEYSDLDGTSIHYYVDNNGMGSAVPTPGAAAVLALGGLIGARRRRKAE
jgi:hypothetical protein